MPTMAPSTNDKVRHRNMSPPFVSGWIDGPSPSTFLFLPANSRPASFQVPRRVTRTDPGQTLRCNRWAVMWRKLSASISWNRIIYKYVIHAKRERASRCIIRGRGSIPTGATVPDKCRIWFRYRGRADRLRAVWLRERCCAVLRCSSRPRLLYCRTCRPAGLRRSCLPGRPGRCPGKWPPARWRTPACRSSPPPSAGRGEVAGGGTAPTASRRAAASRKWSPSGAVCATCRPSACRTGTRTLPAARPTNKFYHTHSVNDRLAHIEEEQRDEEKRKGVMVSLYNRRHDISTSKGTLSLLQQQPSFSLSLCLPSNALTTGSIHLRVWIATARRFLTSMPTVWCRKGIR